MSDAQTAEIRAKVKEVISKVTNIPISEIGDHAAFREDLDLDSLAMLEVGVDVDFAFQLGIEDLDEKLADLPTVDHVVKLVAEMVGERGS